MSRELEVENAVLAACLRNRDTRLGRGHGYLSQEVNTIAPSLRVHAQELMEAIWRLVSMGLVYLDFEQPATENWSARLTDRGRKAADGRAAEPSHPEGYLARFRRDVPTISDIAMLYVRESLASFGSGAAIAAVAMAGVASEAMFFEMADAFCAWLQGQEQLNLCDILDRGGPIVRQLSEVRTRLQRYVPRIPKELADGLPLWLDSLADLLRRDRNDAGHPTGKQFSIDDARAALEIMGRLAQTLCGLRGFFQTEVASGRRA